MLSEAINVPAYDLDAAAEVAKGSDVIYMGWLMAGNVKGYKKAAKKYNIKAICIVGMGDVSGNQAKEFAEKNQVTGTPVFYLQGGFKMENLHGIYRFMMNSMKKAMLPKLEQKTERTAEEEQTILMMTQGADYVSSDNLKQVTDWYQAQ